MPGVLPASATSLSQLLDKLSEGLCVITGPAGARRIRYYNRAFQEHFGLPAELDSATGLVLGEDHLLMLTLDSLLQTGRPSRTLRLPGRRLALALQPGAADELIVTARDISHELRHEQDIRRHQFMIKKLQEIRKQEANHLRELRQTAEALNRAKHSAEEAHQLKTQFLANMSHELRTPLNTIISFAEFLGDEELTGSGLTPEQAHYQRHILESAEYLLKLITTILDFSKIEAGQMQLGSEAFELTPLLQRALDELSGMVRREVALTLEVEPELPLVWADRTRILQVLLNLLSNAAKFTEAGQITLRARRREAGYVQVDVCDTGIGIAPEHQQLIFEEFRQVDGALNRKHQGTGLGLPICKRLVELHGGTLWLESTPGQGSVFSLSLPTAEQLASFTLRASPPAAHTERILVVDDDPRVHEVLAAMLAAEGFAVSSIQDSRSAIDAIRSWRPSLVILDILMPYRDGWDVLADIRRDPELAELPVLICSAIESAGLSVLMEAQGFLHKPVRRDELLALVRQWAVPGPSVVS